MPDRYRVECIKKRDRASAHERIQGIGGRNPEGSASPRWYVLEDDAIKAIKDRKWAFFVIVGGREANIVVAKHENREYLKTTADGYAPNNLLSLPDCP